MMKPDEVKADLAAIEGAPDPLGAMLASGVMRDMRQRVADVIAERAAAILRSPPQWRTRKRVPDHNM